MRRKSRRIELCALVLPARDLLVSRNGGLVPHRTCLTAVGLAAAALMIPTPRTGWPDELQVRS
jgi:hypothetical protein